MSPFDFSWMVGERITQVSFSEPSQWFFPLGDNRGISVYCPWRILNRGRIAVSYEDHNQKFGLPAPIDAVESASSLLVDVEIREVKVREGTLDILIALAVDLRWKLFHFPAVTKVGKLHVPRDIR